jgi:stearoyl-CoA desaturase (delta-9 desaturase)
MYFLPYRQTQLVIWINQLLFFGFLFFYFHPWMIISAVVGMYIFGFMSESSLHRYYTHKSYDTTVFKEKILRVFAFLTGQGATISWVTVHRTHHAYEDTEKDPHSPKHLAWWKIYLAFLPKEYKNNLVIDLMRSPAWKYFVLENKYYFYMWCTVWLLTYFLSFYLFFSIVAGVSMWYIGTCIVNIATHSRGNKRFPQAVAYNSSVVNFFTGVGNHNNHHRFPKSHTYSIDKEIDPYGFIIEKFLIIKQ